MPEQFFMPHRFESESLDIEVHGIASDAANLDPATHVSVTAGTIDLTTLPTWQNCRIHVHVRDMGGVLEDLIGDDEEVDTGIELLLTIATRGTRQRSAVRLVRNDDAWTGHVDLERIAHHGTIDARAIAVRNSSRAKTGSLAFRMGERLADSKIWRIYIDDRPAAPGGAIDNEWRKFRTDQSEQLNKIADCPWFLDLSNENRPRLLLNEDIDGLKRALSSTQRTGRAARVRDTLIQSMLQPVVTHLVLHALQQSRDLADLLDWQRGVLLSVAGKATDSCTAEVCAERWLTEWSKGNTVVVLPELATGVQRHLEVGQGAAYLVKALEERDHG